LFYSLFFSFLFFLFSFLFVFLLFLFYFFLNLFYHCPIVDKDGYKMSKSEGNGIEPSEVLASDQYSADILRLWVCSVDFKEDMPFSFELLNPLALDYRKVRTTCRFLISNLVDFNFASDALPTDSLLSVDKYALSTVSELYDEVMAAYASFKFSVVQQKLLLFCRTTVSSWWVEAAKMRYDYIAFPCT